MIKSNYTISFRTNENIVAFNSFSGALVKIPFDKEEMFNFYLLNPDDLYPEDLEADFKRNMVYGGFLSEVNQLEMLKIAHLRSKYNTSFVLGMTLMPTQWCNFRCPYCYEDLKNIFMNERIQNRIIEYIDFNIKELKKDTIYINWYGGEPLLNPDVIKKINSYCITLEKEKKIKFLSRIITNGYLLNEDMIKLLQSLKISSFQITVDGCKNTHNKRRILSDGGHTYDAIMENIKILTEYYSKGDINIRVNVDQSMIDKFDLFLSEIESSGLKEKISLYIAPVIPTKNYNTCLSNNEFNEYYFTLLEHAAKRGFYLYNYPKPTSIVCMADAFDGGIAIDSEGNIYKCWENVGDEKNRVGHIDRAPKDIFMKSTDEKCNFYKWINNDVFDDKECVECALLPICLGGCPAHRLRVDKQCSLYKEKIVHHLALFYDNLKRK